MTIFTIIRLAPVAAFALLAACGSSEPEKVGGPADPNAEAAAELSQNIVLPPALIASRTLRCKDNSVVYVDFFADNITVDVRKEKTGVATRLTAPAAGEAYVADGGYSVKGAATDATITVALPGGAAQSCKG